MREETEKQLERAIEKVNARPASDEPFELKELFGKEWKSFDNAFRRELGQVFSYRVSQGKVPNVKYAGEKQNHHNSYLKVKD